MGARPSRKLHHVCCISLTSSPDEVKPPGASVKLSCQISGYALTSYGTGWIKQTPRKGLEWIGIIWGGGSINYGSSFKTRFSISRDTSNNVLYLDISSLVSEDTAVYYCAKTDTAVQLSARDSYGQSLTSSASVVKKPGESVTLSCTVSGLSPLLVALDPTETRTRTGVDRAY
ncbi:hypothetical protein QTP70_008024 [Hemibagrus guttatus]|uniref:Ig-like domain-containing protein n=1 Tax=Hemibagrus guttatus TaxID=175788 RepID=A0AAE0QFZ9_9TELE|nr:hypothetical protein QTP70_008024 [Hemibagrus guttatus]